MYVYVKYGWYYLSYKKIAKFAEAHTYEYIRVYADYTYVSGYHVGTGAIVLLILVPYKAGASNMVAYSQVTNALEIILYLNMSQDAKVHTLHNTPQPIVLVKLFNCASL